MRSKIRSSVSCFTKDNMSMGSDKLPPLTSPPVDRPVVSIVIVVWNAKKYVFECLSSLREHCRDLSAEVIR